MAKALNGVGVWDMLFRFGDPDESADAVAEIEELGFTAVWMPDAGPGLFEALERTLAATTSITVASGILNVWMHDAHTSAAAYHELQAAHGDRLLIGLGVSHAPAVNQMVADNTYRRPLAKMTDYLDTLDAADPPLPAGDRVLAALGPKMLRLARDRAAGAHPYLVTPEHTADARAELGPDRLLAPEQGVVLETDPDTARTLARKNLEVYFGFPNYVNNWRRYGFADDETIFPGSDRLIDALVAWGDEEAISRRVQAHRDAGADHVCLQVMVDRETTPAPREQWRRLSAALC